MKSPRWSIDGELDGSRLPGTSRIKSCIPYGDAREQNGASGLQFLRSNAPKIRPEPPTYHLGGSSPVSLYSLYHATHASTACDLFAKACFEICPSIQSMSDWSTVTFMRGLFSIESHFISSHGLNTFEIDVSSISFSEIGALQNDENNCASASYGHAGPGHFRGPDDELPRERLGHRPRRSMGLSPALPHAGADGGPAGGDGLLPPQDLPGIGGDPREGVTA